MTRERLRQHLADARVVVDDEDARRASFMGGETESSIPSRPAAVKTLGLDSRAECESRRRRQALADALGLGVVLLVLLDFLRPSLLLLPTITAGGDTPCHYPTAVWFYERLLPAAAAARLVPGRLPRPPAAALLLPAARSCVMSALAPLAGHAGRLQARHRARRVPAAAPRLRLVPSHALRAFPRRCWARRPRSSSSSSRRTRSGAARSRARWPASSPTPTASASRVLFLGVALPARMPTGAARGCPARRWRSTALAHGYAVLWAGLGRRLLPLSARARRAVRARSALARVGGGARSPSRWRRLRLLPLLADWGWTTPYDDPWITVDDAQPLPAAAVAAVRGRGSWGSRRRLVRRAPRRAAPTAGCCFLAHAALVGRGAGRAPGPALGVIDVRFVPLRPARARAARAAPTLGLRAAAAARSPTWRRSGSCWSRLIRGRPPLARAALLDRLELHRARGEGAVAGLARARGRAAGATATARGRRVQRQSTSGRARSACTRRCPSSPAARPSRASTTRPACTTHPVYYLASELCARSPNPFRSRELLELRHRERRSPRLRLFNVQRRSWR